MNSNVRLPHAAVVKFKKVNVHFSGSCQRNLESSSGSPLSDLEVLSLISLSSRNLPRNDNEQTGLKSHTNWNTFQGLSIDLETCWHASRLTSENRSECKCACTLSGEGKSTGVGVSICEMTNKPLTPWGRSKKPTLCNQFEWSGFHGGA